MIKVGEKPVAQGDLIIRRIDKLPDGLVAVPAEDGFFVVAHSGTGHHHAVLEKPGVKFFQDPSDAVVAYLQVICDDVKLEHQRSFDTHDPYALPPGVYKINRQVESSPQGFQRVAD